MWVCSDNERQEAELGLREVDREKLDDNPKILHADIKQKQDEEKPHEQTVLEERRQEELAKQQKVAEEKQQKELEERQREVEEKTRKQRILDEHGKWPACSFSKMINDVLFKYAPM